jgi:hypothetical protein
MTMVAGSVAIADDGTVSGSGWALVFFNDYKVKIPLPTGAPVTALRPIADLANSMATLITYIQANAHAKIEPTDSGLQRVPSGGAGTPTDGPSAEKLLPIA